MAEQRPYRIAGTGNDRLWRIKAGVMLGLVTGFIVVNWIATQRAARLCGYAAGLGPPMIELPLFGPLYPPWQWIAWWWRWRNAPEERKKRGAKSAVIVEQLVRVQLRAMGCERFELGIRRDAGEMILREGQGAIEIEGAIKWLRHENAKGAHIYIRPAGVHSLSLIDDLTAEFIERMKADGFEPAVVVESSPNKFQAWLNHGKVLDAA